MPFGLKNAGATYERAMNVTFHGLLLWTVEIYINDIVVNSKQEKEHILQLKPHFEGMRDFKLKLIPMKCALEYEQGIFLDF